MPLAGGFPCPTGQALVYRLVYAAEKKQRIQEALALLEAAGEEEGQGDEKGKGAGWASAVVALLVPESGEQQPRREAAGAGYDVI